MYIKRLMALIFCFVILGKTFAQTPTSETEAEIKSLAMYNASQWKELLQYGKSAIDNHIDFPLLRMRIGYSAFMLGNYSQSLMQYSKVLEQGAAAELTDAALYYCYLNNVYLNNTSASGYYAAKLPEATRVNEKIQKVKLRVIEAEYGFKHPQDSLRGDADYSRVGLGVQLGYRLQLNLSAAMYNQIINEQGYVGVTNNNHIDIKQRELYAKLQFAVSGNVTFTGAYHYIYTPFNNFIYNNQIGYAALKYATPFVQVQAAANIGKLGDSSFHQYDGTISVLPLGNLNLYFISRFSSGATFTISQIAGLKVMKNVWLEGNVVVGKYKTLLENDGLYVFNDIDEKQLKAGGTIYVTLFKKLNVSANYTFEKKQKIFTKNNFNQQSINGGLVWNF